MPSRHRRSAGWSTWKWPGIVVALGLIVSFAGSWHGTPQNAAARHGTPQNSTPQHGTPSQQPPRRSPLALPAPANGRWASSEAPPAGSPPAARPSCPVPSGPPTRTVGPGGRYATIQSAVDAASAGDTVEIAGGTYHEAVDLTRSGSAGAYLTLRARAGETVTIDGGNTLPTSGKGLLTIDGARYVRISGLTLVNSHQHGLYADRASDLVIENTVVSHTQDGGIFVGDAANAVLTCNSVDHSNSAASGGNVDAAANEALSLVAVSDFQITNNTVFQNYEEGIDVKNGSHNGTVQNNASYLNTGPNIYLDGASDVTLSANRVYGAKGSSKAGIALGVESGGTAQNVEIFNNVIYSNAGGGIDLWVGHYSHVQIYYNTIYANGRAAVRAESGVVTDSVARDNIAFDNALINVSGFSLSNNLTSNPGFVNVSAGDVRLGSGSAALNRGSMANAPATDFAGHRRPLGSAPDLGAYESG